MTTTSLMNDFTSMVTHEAGSSKEVTTTSDANIGIIKVGASPVQVTANGTLKTPSNGTYVVVPLNIIEIFRYN